MRKLNTRVFTPNPDIQSTPLAADLLAFAGCRHPTRRSMMNALELIAVALDAVKPEGEKAGQLAEELATHFHRWAQTIEEDAETQEAGEPDGGTPISAMTPAPVLYCGLRDGPGHSVRPAPRVAPDRRVGARTTLPGHLEH